jgi:hypothetical protein
MERQSGDTLAIIFSFLRGKELARVEVSRGKHT